MKIDYWIFSLLSIEMRLYLVFFQHSLMRHLLYNHPIVDLLRVIGIDQLDKQLITETKKTLK